MILGIIAAELANAGGGGPDWVPAGADLYCDFINDRYWLSGSVVDRATVLTFLDADRTPFGLQPLTVDAPFVGGALALIVPIWVMVSAVFSGNTPDAAAAKNTLPRVPPPMPISGKGPQS